MKYRNLSKLITAFLFAGLSAASVFSQEIDGTPYDLNRDVVSDPLVSGIVNDCTLRFRRAELAGEFRLADYSPAQSWTENGVTFPRRPRYLYRSIRLINGVPPQFSLSRVARGILGDSSATAGSWAYDNMRSLMSNPASGNRRPTQTDNQCYNNVCFQNIDILRELREMGVLDTFVSCVLPRLAANGRTTPAQTATLAQVIINRGFINLRNQTSPGNDQNLPNESPLANLYFRYAGARSQGASVSAGERRYAEWTKTNLFTSLHPEITTTYGYWTLVLSDPGHRTIDLNAYNHAYYQGSNMSLLRFNPQTQQNYSTSLGRRFYSCSPVDNAEFIVPGYVRPREYEGMDFHERNGNSGRRQITISYRKISLHTPAGVQLDNRGNFNYTPVLVIDPQGATCVTLDDQERPVRCARRGDPFDSALTPTPQPSTDPSDRLPVLGIIGLCANPTAENCQVPASLEVHYAANAQLAVSDAARQAHAEQISTVSSVDPIYYASPYRGRIVQQPLFPVYKPFVGVSSSFGGGNGNSSGGTDGTDNGTSGGSTDGTGYTN